MRQVELKDGFIFKHEQDEISYEESMRDHRFILASKKNGVRTWWIDFAGDQTEGWARGIIQSFVSTSLVKNVVVKGSNWAFSVMLADMKQPE